MGREAIWERLAEFGKTLNSPERLKLLHLLAQCERSVEALAEVAEAPVTRVSHHLQRLKSARLIRGERQGRKVIYSLANPEVAAFWVTYRDFVTSQNPELRLLAMEAERADDTINYAGAKERLDAEEAILIDIRPIEEFEAGHLPAAISVPLTDFTAGIRALPHDKTVIVCCRGPYCQLAASALQILHGADFQAVRLIEGTVDMQAALKAQELS